MILHGIFLPLLEDMFRERGREGEREGEKHRCERDTLIGSCTHSDWGPNLQPRYVPWLGIISATF